MSGAPSENGHAPAAENGSEQRAAREAVMEIQQFPELQIRLTRVFGPTAARDMLHQLVYWFRKAKYRDRWTIYITADDWREQRGLNRKQVDKGRARLKPFGVVEEKMGPYKRIHYRIDWITLAELLSIPLKGGQKPSAPPKGIQESSDTPKGGAIDSAPPSAADEADTYPDNPRVGGGQTNIGEYSGDYPGEISLRKGGAVGEADRGPGERGEKIEKCVEILRSIEGFDLRPSDARALVSTQAGLYPSLDPENVCQKYRDHAVDKAGKGDPIKYHRSYLPGFFERAEHRRASEPRNPHSPEAGAAKTRPNPYPWFVSFFPWLTEERYRSMVDAKMTHAEMLEVLEEAGGREMYVAAGMGAGHKLDVQPTRSK